MSSKPDVSRVMQGALRFVMVMGLCDGGRYFKLEIA